MRIKTGLGQDSHRFMEGKSDKPLTLGGAVIPGARPLEGNSDADVVLHSLTNALSSITGKNVLGAIADEMCLRRGITDSREYVREALKDMGRFRISHASFSLECSEPKIAPNAEKIRGAVAKLLGLGIEDVGLTATSGEQLTEFGRGKGIQAFCIVTAIED